MGAVRSSATAEDGAGAKFAGIHTSFLNVRGLEGVLRSILGCYCSLWTPQALAYRRKMNFADDEVLCAVVICQMVQAEGAREPLCAGVAINVGWLIFAALLPDFLLGWFTLAGWESYTIPSDYHSVHYLLFTFPWSHGLLADVAWAAIAGVVAWTVARRKTAAAAVAVAVLSHFLLDGIVHVKGLPLAGNDGPVFGLGLWRHLPLELSIEAAMAAAALWIYRSAAKTGGSKRWMGMAVYIAALTPFLIVGQAGATEVPARGELIVSWLAVLPAMSAIAFWLDRRRPSGQSAG